MSELCKNTDRELWRETDGDYYSPSIHVTESGGIGINVDGLVTVMPIAAWHSLSRDLAAARAEIMATRAMHLSAANERDALKSDNARLEGAFMNAAGLLDTARAEIARLTNTLAKLTAPEGTVTLGTDLALKLSRGCCQHCGWEGATTTDHKEARREINAHQVVCLEHPMRAVEAERDDLRSRNGRLVESLRKITAHQCAEHFCQACYDTAKDAMLAEHDTEEK